MKLAIVLLAAVASVHSTAIRSGRQGWGPSGWSSTTPGWSTTPPPAGWSTTSGWSTAPPAGWSTTSGWSTAPPAGWSTTSGWSTAPPAGWSTTSGWSTAPPTTAGWSTPGWSGGKASGWGTPSPAPGWGSPPGWSAPSSSVIDLNAALAAAGSGWAAENHSDNVQVTGAGGWGGPNAELAIFSSGESIVDQAGSILQVTDQDSENAASINLASVGQVALGTEGQELDALGLEISNEQSGWAAASGEGATAAEADSSIVISKKH